MISFGLSGWGLKPVTSGDTDGKTWMQTEGHADTEAEAGVMWPQKC